MTKHRAQLGSGLIVRPGGTAGARRHRYLEILERLQNQFVPGFHSFKGHSIVGWSLSPDSALTFADLTCAPARANANPEDKRLLAT